MKFVQELSPGSFIVVSEDSPVIVVDDVQWPSSILSTWNPPELSASAIYAVSEFVVPPGHQVVGNPTYERVGDEVIETYDTVPVDVPVPEQITRRQLILALYLTGYMSGEEAEAAAEGGAVPQFIASVLAGMDPDQVRLFKITWASMDSAVRHDPTMVLFMDHAGLTETQRDDYFSWASTL